MRQIGTIEHEPEAQRFSAYLTHQSIDHSVDASFDLTTQSPSYALWVHNEDQIQLAAGFLERFLQNPSSSEFDVPITEQTPSQEDPPVELSEESDSKLSRKSYRITTFFIALCALIFFLNTIQESSLRKEGFSQENFLMTPLQMNLLYDEPLAFEQLEKIIQKYQLQRFKKIETLSPEIKAEIEAVEKSPFFRGIYDWIVLKATGQNADSALGPLFYKIRQGQVWRLFTPCILHAGLLHIGFNMLWLWILGRQIEERIGWMKYLLLTLFLGVIGNTMQYLMSGPFFLGYSGIITGLAGFIWSRERVAPWEGYPLQRSMIRFLALFVIAMSMLQLVSLFFVLFTSVNFTPNIANAAHISGALAGIFLGRLSFFQAKGT